MYKSKWSLPLLLVLLFSPLGAQEETSEPSVMESLPTTETLSPSVPQEVLEQLGQIRTALESNDNELAFNELNDLTANYPELKLSGLYLSLADIFDNTGDWRRSIASYEQYLDQVTSSQVIPVEEYWNIGWAYYMTGRPEKALEAGLRFAQVYPNNTQHNLNLALYYLTLGFEIEATHIYMWSFSVTLDPLSLYWLALGDLEKARNLFFYAYAKDHLNKGWQQLKTLEFVQENL